MAIMTPECHQCKSEINLRDRDLILISRNRNSTKSEQSFRPLRFHVDCFKYLAGEEFIPKIPMTTASWARCEKCYYCSDEIFGRAIDKSFTLISRIIGIGGDCRIESLYFHTNCFFQVAGIDFVPMPEEKSILIGSVQS